MPSKIFICYRRNDSAGHAGRVHDRLAYEFGAGLVFMDVDSIPLGSDFVKVIKSEVAACDILLAIIGPMWALAYDSSGKTRLDSSHDFVRIEIAAALERNIPVIPILLDNAPIPTADMLPDDLQPLAFRNGIHVRHESFAADIQKLLTFLHNQLNVVEDKGSGVAPAVRQALEKPQVEPEAVTPKLATLEAALQSMDGVAKRDDLAAMAEELAAKDPELASIIRSAAVRVEMEAYLRCDAEAIEQQKRLVSEITVSNVCMMLAGVASALVLAGAMVPATVEAWLGGFGSNRLSLTLGGTTVLLGSRVAFWARDQNRFTRWTTRRSEAEAARIAVFKAVAAQAAAMRRPAEAMKAFAFIVRYLLDAQRAWLKSRVRNHRRSSEWTTFWGQIAAVLVIVGGSGAVIAGMVQGAAWLALPGVIAAAVAAYATNREALRRDRPNIDCYEKAEAVFHRLAARVDGVAAQIAAGKVEALTAFTDAVAEQLISEHKQWLEGAAQAEGVLAKLDARLGELRGTK